MCMAWRAATVYGGGKSMSITVKLKFAKIKCFRMCAFFEQYLNRHVYPIFTTENVHVFVEHYACMEFGYIDRAHSFTCSVSFPPLFRCSTELCYLYSFRVQAFTLLL